VTRIDAPHLGDIKIIFFNQLIFHISQLGRFIDRIEMQKSHRRADILSSGQAISIAFTHPEAHGRLTLQISCEQLDWQLSSMAQLCDQFSSSGLLFGVRDLRINTTQQSSGQDDADSEHWPELIHSFSGVERFSLAGKLVTNVLRTFRAADGVTSLLPALKFLCIQGPRSGDLRAAIRSFVTSRQLSGRPVNVEYTGADSQTRTKIQPISIAEPREMCEYCYASFKKQDLDQHLCYRRLQGEREGECEFCGGPCQKSLKTRQGEVLTLPSPQLLHYDPSIYPGHPDVWDVPSPISFDIPSALYSDTVFNLASPSEPALFHDVAGPPGLSPHSLSLSSDEDAE